MSLFINFTKLFISNGFYYKYLFIILLILLILMMSLLLILCDGLINLNEINEIN